MVVRQTPPLRRVALFDMDKTLIRGNSAELFLRYRKRRGEVGVTRMLQMSFWLLQYSFGLLDAERVAKKVLSEYRGTEEEALRRTCEEWMTQDVLPLISPLARSRVARHREAGDLVAIVTSATSYGTAPLAQELGIEHMLCSELQVNAGLFTGEIIPPLCYGTGKVERTEQFLLKHNLSFESAVFYSDSITDLPLLQAVATPVAVNPDLRLLKTAKRNAWKVERW